MSIVYLIPGNMTGGPYGIKELKRREKLLKSWSYNPSKVKVYDVPNGGSSIESSYEEIASIIPAVDRLREITKFENIDAARTFYLSDEYQAAKAVRDACAETDLMIIEGA